jgi:hypothetical protein
MIKNLLADMSSRNVSNIALAYFVNPRNLHDAATDLCSAGFRSDAINITGRLNSLSLNIRKSTASTDNDTSVDQHTWRWRVRRFLVHDGHRRGADQISGDDRDPLVFLNPQCNRIDLRVVLAQMNVTDAIAELLQIDTKSERTFMLVDAQDRVSEASEILQRNAGQLRTDYLLSA